MAEESLEGAQAFYDRCGMRGYRGYLARHPEEWPDLDACCRITISSFYRDRAVFDTLRDPVLPELARAARARGAPVVRAWSAGCASGEEPYTLSLAWNMEASRHDPGCGFELVASDLDPVMLDRARIGCYSPAALHVLPAEWVASGFEQADDALCLRMAFRHCVRIVEQDIREEMPSGSFDLVLCRNLVFTYFEASLQVSLLGRILERLAPSGVLVLGAHEALPRGEWPLERAYGALPIFRQARR